ncbi:S8 family serine peptidase [Vitiosangium sp. GDMCC 1.1324]|uniref:S8 family serine peptidase n=1 Tax=Vitiosangium sp. (strain GDMCC 1.1324) TaxID=2138576 RepID=UPI000D350040|nr:S8 family serine peptidase [Vitiosangium sp. GDMCC 1.1324]PTL77326.1 peptidase S8 [Vitiosangium sp. GDMCC 1.1324]
MPMKRWTLANAVLSLVVAAAACASPPDSGGSREAEQEAAVDTSRRVLAEEEPGGIVVDFKDGTSKAEFDAWESEWGVDLEFNSVEGEHTGVTIARDVGDVDAVLARIRQNPAVESAEPLRVYSVPPGEEAVSGLEDSLEETSKDGYTPNDPDYPKQWNLRMIHMPKAWQQSRGKGVVVAVLDTGIAYEDYDDFKQVPDLKGVKFKKGYDFVNDDEHANDDHGHGTHVAGTIAQATNNGQGVAGVAFEATLMPVKVLNHFGSGTSADIAEAIRFAADHGANVINMSLGGGGYSKVMADAVEYARKKGVTVVAAAGNAGRPRVEFPAAYPGAVAVAAVGPSGTRAPYSSYGKELDIAAPGGDKRQGDAGGILQNTIDPRDVSRSVYAAYQGTSMATPHVAAVAALLYAEGASGPDEVEKALFAGAKRMGEQAWTEEYGHGLLDAQASLEALGGGASRWPSMWWALALLALVLLTIRGRERPGYLNVLVRPSFLVPLVLATVGVFFARSWFGGASGVAGDVVDAAYLPIPDWQRIIFGRGKLANPLFYSSLIPLLLSFLAIKFKGIRPAIGGLSLGFAGFLTYAAWSKAPALAWMPFNFLALPWLVVNTLICLIIARAMLRKESAV